MATLSPLAMVLLFVLYVLVSILVSLYLNRNEGFDPVVLHVIKATADSGAPVSREWESLAYHHEIYIAAIRSGHPTRGLRGAA